MSKLVLSIVFLLTVIAIGTAQIQQSPNNRVYVDDDYEYTETARRTRSLNASLETGTKFYKSGDYKSALEAFSSAVTLDPSVFVSQFNLGVTHLYLSDYKSAIDCLQEAVKLNQSSASAWHFLGSAIQSGDDVSGIEAARLIRLLK